MLQHQTFLRCSRRTATIILTIIILLFLAIGCASILRKAGLAPNQADEKAAAVKAALVDAAAEAVADIQEGIAQGKTPQTIALETGSAFAWKMATLAASTIGAVLSALLANWLRTERKISAACITAIEKANDTTVKESVKDESFLAGVQSKLHRRVKALT